MRVPDKGLRKLVATSGKVNPKDETTEHKQGIVFNLRKSPGKYKVKNEQIEERVYKTPYNTQQ